MKAVFFSLVIPLCQVLVGVAGLVEVIGIEGNQIPASLACGACFGSGLGQIIYNKD